MMRESFEVSQGHPKPWTDGCRFGILERMETLPTTKLARVRRLCASGSARAIREAAGLSLAEVAEPVGVSRQAVLRWELGQRRPRGEPAFRYLDVLEELAG